MRSEAELKRAIEQMAGVVKQAIQDGEIQPAYFSHSIQEALEWAAGEDNQFGELLDEMETIMRAERQ